MTIKEPFEYMVALKHPDKVGFFKVDDMRYLPVTNFDVLTFNEGDMGDFLILKNDKAIPLILYHNWAVNAILQEYKSTGKRGNHRLYVKGNQAIIDNQINYINYDFGDILKKFHGSKSDKLETREVYLWLIDRILNDKEFTFKEKNR